MIILKDNPEALYDANQGDMFELDGHQFVLEFVSNRAAVFLTMTSDTTNVERVTDGYDSVHVRSTATMPGVAVMSRKEMVDRIKNNTYLIG